MWFDCASKDYRYPVHVSQVNADIFFICFICRRFYTPLKQTAAAGPGRRNKTAVNRCIVARTTPRARGWAADASCDDRIACDAYLDANVSFPEHKCCSASDLRTSPRAHLTSHSGYRLQNNRDIDVALFIQTSSLCDRFLYARIYDELMIHIITEEPVYIRMVDVQIFNSARVFTQTRCIVDITLCGCVWLFDKTIPLGNSFYLYNPPIAQR